MSRVIKAQQHRDYRPEAIGPLHLDDLAAEARRTILFARRRSERILAEAREEAEVLRQEIDRSGYNEGFARGRQEGQAEGKRLADERLEQEVQQRMGDLRARLSGAIDELTAARGRVIEQARAHLLSLAIRLAEKIVGPVAAADPGAAQANVEKVLALAADGQVTLKVHPAQAEAVGRYCAERNDDRSGRRSIELVGDERIAPGGVKLVTAHGEIDATIETQMDNVVAALLAADTRDPLTEARA